MEQVFLRVGELEEKKTKDNLSPESTSETAFLNQSFDSNSEGISNEPTIIVDQHNGIESNSISAVPNGAYRELKLSGKSLLFQRFRSLCKKKFIYSRRKWLLIFTQAIIPVLVSCLCLSVDSGFDEQDFKEPPRKLSLDMFDYSYSSVDYDGKFSRMVADNYIDLFNDPYKVNVTNNVTNDLLDVANKDLNAYRENYVTSAVFSESASNLLTKIMYQSIPYHTTGIGINLIDNALLHTLCNDSFSITTNNAPFPINKAWQMDDTPTTYSSTLYMMTMPLALAFLTSSFIVFPLQERISNAKQIQLMTGTSPFLLWLTTFVWDMLTYILTAILIFIFFMAFDSKGYFTEDGARGALFLLLLLYGFASVPMAYVFSFLFHSSASGFALLALINIIAGLIISSVTLVLRASDSANLIQVANIIGNITAFIPSYPASKSFMSIVDMTNYNRFCDVVSSSQVDSLCKTIEDYSINSSFIRCCPQCAEYGDCFKELDYLQWQYPGLGKHFMYFAVDSIFYFIILFLLEIGLKDLISFQLWKLIRRFSPVDVKETEEQVDDDVEREKHVVDELMKKPNVEGTAIIVQDLCKTFSKSGVVAVKGISFLVNKGECFGLLGVNGAGKTTTFRMLTGDEIRSSGDARIGFNYLSHGRKKFMEEIGYCPQFDAIIGELTGVEMLSLMAGLRGVEKKRQSELIRRLVDLVDLTECAKRPSSTYSGGNKRKLSTAMAMIGQPPIVFLDEPTSGVDPASRRRVWEAVRDATSCGQSVILTSHSMDECEALCSRLVIMSKGVLRCSGTPKHLKAKFGSGRVLQVKIKSNLPNELRRMSINKDSELLYQERVEELKDVLSSCFNSATLTDEHRGMLVYKIPSSYTWAELFSTMEALKGGRNIPEDIYTPTNGVKKPTTHLKYLIEDYAATDSSLEQVFLTFARENQNVEMPNEKTQNLAVQNDKTKSPVFKHLGTRRGSYTLS